jgi:hypothetical protein
MQMSKPSTAVKMRYNRAAYDRYEINVGKDTELTHRLMKEKNVAGLIKELLCQHYEITLDQTHDYIAEQKKGAEENGP